MNGLIVELFAFRDNIKLFHFQTPSYAAHVAADGLEKKIAVSLDSLLEVMQGTFHVRPTIKNEKIQLMTLVKPDTAIVEYCRRFIEKLQAVAGELDKFESITNIMAEIVADVQQFLYLLTFE